MDGSRRVRHALGQQLASVYVVSPEAQAVAGHAVVLGIGEVRLGAATPFVTYLVAVPPSEATDALAAHASVVWGMTIFVESLWRLPAWRRDAAWAAASPVLPPGAATTPKVDVRT